MSFRHRALLAASTLSAAACMSPATSLPPAPDVSAPSPLPGWAASPTPDPRVGLKAGWFDAGEAIWNLRMVSTTRPSEKFMNASTPGDARLKNSDLAFTGNYVVQGNYSGWQVWDIANPARPTLKSAYVCPGAQSDVSVYRNLMFVSHESTAGRIDCGLQGIADTVSKDRARGVRIYDISDMARPRMVTVVQTCRGSHTHTVVDDPKDRENVYIYVSGTSGVRSPSELPGCSGGTLDLNPNSADFRIEVIKVPLAHPERAVVMDPARVVANLDVAPRNSGRASADSADRARAAAGRGGGGGRGRGGAGGGAGADSDAVAGGRGGRGGAPARPTGPRGCHDVTAYPAMGLLGGACGGYGLLVDISNVARPVRIDAAADSNFSFWHSATFSNDGSKVLFSDEWGGGSAAKCRSSDRMEWGANTIFTIVNRKLVFQSYYKMPAAQTAFENCVAHNGSLIPIPGRDVMVQAWYQGGISIFDWTDPKNAREIAYHDRGPLDSTRLIASGHWSTYWYNGLIISSDEARGLDIFELTPSPMISQNEIEAAKLVRFAELNVQNQPKLVWPVHFAVARSYVDQLTRSNGLTPGRITTVRNELARAERLSGGQRRSALTALASQLGGDVQGSSDAGKIRMLIGAVNDLANAAR